MQWVTARSPEYGQAPRFILSSGARIDETLHLCHDQIFIDEKQTALKGKGGQACRFIDLRVGHEHSWKDSLERAVRQACNQLNLQWREVHRLCATAPRRSRDRQGCVFEFRTPNTDNTLNACKTARANPSSNIFYAESLRRSITAEDHPASVVAATILMVQLDFWSNGPI